MNVVASLSPDSPSRLLAREVLIGGPLSRGELSRRLGLSVASLTRLSKPLIEAGILQEGREVIEGGVGRPTRPLEVPGGTHRFIGIKLTGTAASGVATDLRCQTVAAAEEPLVSHAVSDVVEAIVSVVGRLNDGQVADGIGISIGGKVSDDGTVLRAPFLQWRDVPLGSLVQERTGIPVTVENDVVALTVGEQWFGAGRGISNFAVLTVGAGVGYGLVINDRVIAPVDAGLGLVGHYPVDSAGPLCREGHRGCAGAVLTMAAISGQVRMATEEECTYEEVLQRARSGERLAALVVKNAGTALGVLIAAVANLTMVNLVVLSGEGAALADIAAEEIRASVHEHRDPEAAPVHLTREPTDFGQWARGAAAVAIQSSILGPRR
ncbi:ROK family transcriptional regulator [Arthrobacter parietis]|uniref:ROK family transcriptional regulator n=1 Tax=Arthrobacter parietis TaxID=271434 RepID=A0ABN3AVN4_9MICC